MGYLRHGTWLIGLLVFVVLGPSAFATTEPPPAYGEYNRDGGSRVVMGKQETREAAMADEEPGVQYEYTAVSLCGGSAGDPAGEFFCEASILECANNSAEQGQGPAMRVFRRALDPTPQPWVFRGVTCYPDLVAGDGPALTMAMIVDAFHDTAFAVPQVSVQPVGGITLVTLPTFFETVFPQEGFEPGEVDTTSLLGFAVDIRPRLDAVTYHFGDGASEGPTVDTGGPYPDGGITHVYSSRGQVQARADVTYGGQFRVDGGVWNDIPGTATITGTPVTITVKESRARLVTPDT